MVNEMGEQVSAECQRQGAWEFLGEGVGAKLLCPDTGTVLTKNHFFGEFIYCSIFFFASLKVEEIPPPVAEKGYINI